MTDTQTALEVGALYEVNGRMVIALTDNRMVVIDKPVEDAFYAPTYARLMFSKDNAEWATRMTQNRNAITSRLKSALDVETHLRERFEALGQALLEKAIEKEWCGEYDEFAQEWDLPLMAREVMVTVTVTVRARNEEEAIDLVRAEVGLGQYDDHVVSGPEYTAEEG